MRHARRKRALDLFVSAVGLIILSPLLIFLAALVRWRLGSPVIFRQVRPGLDERLFAIYKFRTMRDARDAQGNLLDDAARLTDFGHWLRATSLDELPELWNVLKGEMSLVGPRPLLVEYLPRYSERQRLRHTVRPGITGWAQINGRNAIAWDDKLEMDAWYAENTNIGLDLRILAKTVASVIARRGISAPGHATTPPFAGQKKS